MPRKDTKWTFQDENWVVVETTAGSELAARRKIRKIDRKLQQSLRGLPMKRRGKLTRIRNSKMGLVDEQL